MDGPQAQHWLTVRVATPHDKSTHREHPATDSAAGRGRIPGQASMGTPPATTDPSATDPSTPNRPTPNPMAGSVPDLLPFLRHHWPLFQDRRVSLVVHRSSRPTPTTAGPDARAGARAGATAVRPADRRLDRRGGPSPTPGGGGPAPAPCTGRGTVQSWSRRLFRSVGASPAGFAVGGDDPTTPS